MLRHVNESSFTADDLARMAQQINLFVLPIILVVGFAGNSAAIFIILKTSLRFLPSNRLLVALAIADAVFIITTTFLWLDINDFVKLYSESIAGCKMLTFAASFADMASVWFTVGVTFERFCILFYPNLRKTFGSNSFVSKYILCVVVLSAMLTLWVALSASVALDLLGTYCDTVLDISLYQTLNVIDTVLSCFLPSLIILSLTVAIAQKIGMFLRKTGIQEELLSSNSSSSHYTSEVIVAQMTTPNSGRFKNRRISNGNEYKLALAKANGEDAGSQLFSQKNGGGAFDGAAAAAKRRRSDFRPSRSLTRALCGVSTIYVFLNLPCYVVRLVNSFVEPEKKGAAFCIIEILAYDIYYAHHALNFYFYTFFSPQMRKALCKILRDFTYFVCICECCNFHGCMDIDDDGDDTTCPL